MRLACRGILLLAILNFDAFWYSSLALGGDAGSGKIEDGRYFLGDHGVYTEVSQETYRYSLTHGHSLWFTHALAALSALALYAQGDPFLVRRDRRRDRVFFGIWTALLLVCVIGGSTITRAVFWLLPLVFTTFILLDMRGARRAQDPAAGATATVP